MGERQQDVEPALRALFEADNPLRELHARIAPHFPRAEVRERAFRFVQGLVAQVPRKNGWQLAEAVGERGPRGVQRLLGEANWDEEAVRDELPAYVVEQLGEEQGILVVDETGFLKKAEKQATSPQRGDALPVRMALALHQLIGHRLV